MSYVQRVLQPGEVVRYLGSLHWYTYLPGLLCMLAAIVAIAWAELGAHVTIFWHVVAALFAIVPDGQGGFEPLKGIARPIELRTNIIAVASENPNVSHVSSALQSKPGKA